MASKQRWRNQGEGGEGRGRKRRRGRRNLTSVLFIEDYFSSASPVLPEALIQYSTKVYKKGHENELFSQKITSGSSEALISLMCGEHHYKVNNGKDRCTCLRKHWKAFATLSGFSGFYICMELGQLFNLPKTLLYDRRIARFSTLKIKSFKN